MPALRPHLEAEVDVLFATSGRPVEPRDVFGLLQDYSSVEGGMGDVEEGQELYSEFQCTKMHG